MLNLVVGVVAGLLVSGCASKPASSGAVAVDPVFGSVPGDLTIDVTILPGRNIGRYDAAHLQRSRYILFCDGSLHGDVGPSVGVLTRPGAVRTMTHEEMADLWLVARRTGFADLDRSEFDGNAALLTAGPNEVLVIVSIVAEGRTGTFIRRTPPAEMDPDTRGFLRALADLAWSSDAAALERVIIPLRYDMGPDPYRRFLPPAPIRPPAGERR